MRFNLFFVMFMFAAFMQNSAKGQESRPSGESTSIVEERMRNSEVKQHKFSNGSVLTEYKFAGSMQPNVDLDCIAINEVTNQFNPPALYLAAKKCLQRSEYSKGWALIQTANGFAYYDVKRLADKSIYGARSVLAMNTFTDWDDESRQKMAKIFQDIQADILQVKAYCDELIRIGPPTYEPSWIILHGLGVYDGPRNGHYLLNVDVKSLWKEILKNRCTVSKS